METLLMVAVVLITLAIIVQAGVLVGMMGPVRRWSAILAGIEEGIHTLLHGKTAESCSPQERQFPAA